ncbi:MAG TPA: HNH endonuclease signature motif containing protein [Verrucomicrobiae bacterium]
MSKELTSLPVPFAYPSKPHVRQHGPQGYFQYRQYRNWLRDEFAFRCIYCLRRETWLTMSRDYQIDHFLPKSDHPNVERDYDNLVYACSECNGTKAAKYLPSPESVAYGDCMSVDGNGEIHALNERGKTIIEALRLDAGERTLLRRRIIETIAEARLGSKTLKWCLGYPDDLPNLSAEKKPKDNNRRNGILKSHYERKSRHELPEYY